MPRSVCQHPQAAARSERDETGGYQLGRGGTSGGTSTVTEWHCDQGGSGSSSSGGTRSGGSPGTTGTGGTRSGSATRTRLGSGASASTSGSASGSGTTTTTAAQLSADQQVRSQARPARSAGAVERADPEQHVSGERTHRGTLRRRRRGRRRRGRRRRGRRRRGRRRRGRRRRGRGRRFAGCNGRQAVMRSGVAVDQGAQVWPGRSEA